MVQPGQPQSFRRYLPIALLLCLFTIVGISAGVALAGAAPDTVKQEATSASAANVPQVTATPTPCSAGWSVVSSPNPGLRYNYLYGVAAVSANDVWSVGYYADIDLYETLVEHWDGTAWTMVPSPSPGTSNDYLNAVAAVSANDVWAVGSYNDGGFDQTLVEHWDGTAWTVVSSPNHPSAINALSSVSALASDNVWAVGGYTVSNISQTLVEHWNGSAWTIISSPNVGSSSNFLNGVTGVSPNDIWAVGYSGTQTLVEHWNGTAWTIVPSPSPGSMTNYLYGVAAISANDVWAVGFDSGSGANQTLVEHWNGSAWSVVLSPNPGPTDNYLDGVTAISANNVWAVGYSAPSQTLVEHWDGTNWSPVDSPNPGPTVNQFYGVAAVSAGDVWAVGRQNNIDYNYETLVEHYLDSCSPSPSPTPVATSTATNTPTITNTLTPTDTPTQVCGLRWRLIDSGNPGSGGNNFVSDAAIAPDDVWAVGDYQNIGGSGPSQTLIEHWNGSAWSTVPSPNVGTGNNSLTGISAVSSSDVWAVGTYLDNNSGTYRTLTEQWNGSAWSVVSSPNAISGHNILQGVMALSSSNVWAAGYTCSSNCQSPVAQNLILHWDGSAWTIVTSPDIGGDNNYLWAIGGSAANNLWAVGFHSSCYGCAAQTLILHWDGTQWTIVPSPNVGTNINYLFGVSVLSSNDAWAVGYYYAPSNALWRTLTLHWDGTTWSVISSPNAGQGTHNYLQAVDAIASNDVWAVGDWGVSSGLTLHWDGTTWSVVSSPDSGSGGNWLYGVAATATDNVWAVGENISVHDQTLTQQYNDPCVTPSPIPTSTDTSTNTPTVIPMSTSTNTPISTGTSTSGPVSTYTPTPTTAPASTHTPSPTPTSCTLSFSDVPPGSTFYPYVRCLACRGIINGYPDGTFKPNNDVTRGQLSKIVSNAAGFSDSQPNQMYQDVPLGSTFQLFIGRLASRGYINGYACGGVGEPCVPPANLAYFRPGSNATRGQISKIDANAAGFEDPPSGQQFEDVPAGSTYYTYTYRLVSRGVMGGYPCGGVGEPCVPPGNLPYFRPNNNATRGQTSKIVANTFFPECAPITSPPK